MRGALAAWVRLWDRREPGTALALVRILVPLVIAWDLAEVGLRGLVIPLWAPTEHGGIGPASVGDPVCTFYAWFGASAASTWALYGLTCAATLLLALGLCSRLSALVLLLAYAQLAQLSPDADRGIDTLLRNVLLVLALSPAGRTLSLSARLRTGKFVDPTPVVAWPRYLIVAQLVVLYFFAGMLKQSAHWSFGGGYGALFLVLHKPHFTAFTLPHAWLVAGYPLTQLATFSTVTWERAALLLPGLLYLRGTRARGGLVRTWVNRLRVLELWVALGVLFHLALALLMTLGMFPWGCLALYPALAAPDTLARWASSARGWGARLSSHGGAPSVDRASAPTPRTQES